MSTVRWQRVEAGIVFAAALSVGISLATDGGIAWWLMLLVFFAPDLAFAGYLAGPRAGALLYNIVHIYGFGAAVAILGLALESEVAGALGMLWIGHAGFDRMLGYGLKEPTGFADTHLGRIGRG